jgi:hypothetical protein
MIILKTSIWSKDICISHIKMLVKRVGFTVFLKHLCYMDILLATALNSRINAQIAPHPVVYF